MNLRFWKKKKKLKNELTFDEMLEKYNLALFEGAELHREQLRQALQLDAKRDKNRYVR
jgi:uncharacterized protein (DUF433 family)